jgi:hypothetical protein
MTLTGGEKVLVEHPAQGIDEILAALEGSDFLRLSEIRVGSAGARDIIVSSEHVAIVRPLDSEGQGSQFRPKR